MCYELSQWFTKARNADQARKQQSESEPATRQQELVPEAQGTVAESRVKERERAPA